MMSTPRERAQTLREQQRAAIRRADRAVPEATTEIETAAIESVCRRCYGHAVSTTDASRHGPFAIASTGRAHKLSDADPSRTECGREITDEWTVVQ
jgi:hypothetical protein